MEEIREKRKHEHIRQAMQQESGPLAAGWEDIYFIHQALLSGSRETVLTGTTLFEKNLELPLIINALTGGASGLEKINGSLARVARELGIGLAVGSQTAGLKNRKVRHTYEIVRRENPTGLILANVSALVKPEDAKAVVEMIEADALQLHLNGAQELVMPEGDRDFTSLALNIQKIVEAVGVPVLVKEVGFGLSRETALALYRLGVRALDVSGAGGTNFAAIELARSPEKKMEFLRRWGLPSAISLLEVKELGLPLTLVASGGINEAPEMGKALGLGADVAAIAGPFLKTLVQEGEEGLKKRIRTMGEELKTLMLLVGASTLPELAAVPLVITGFVREWCEQRGIDTRAYAQRKGLLVGLKEDR